MNGLQICAPRQQSRFKPEERGAVLLTTLLLVTFVSALVIAIVDDIRFGISRTINARSMSQAQWYALGAEELAKQAIKQSWRQDPGRSTLNDVWAQGPTVFPIEGGVIEGVINDGSNCFNLNTLVVSEDNRFWARNQSAVDRYVRLLQVIGFGDGDARSLANTAADWVDSDTLPSPGGAEDSYYLALQPSFRTANTEIASVSELRAMRGYDVETYQRIKPFVCALPSDGSGAININTISEDRAALLVMLVGTDLTLAAVRQAIAERPLEGYGSQQEFWAHRSFAGLEISADVKEQVSVQTKIFEVQTNISLNQTYLSLRSTFEQTSNGEVLRLSRQFGATL